MKKTKSIFLCAGNLVVKSALALLAVLSILFAVSCEDTPKPVDKTKSVTVTLSPGGMQTAKKGDTIVFTAAVNAKNGAKNTVTWELNNSPFLNPTTGGSTLTVSSDGFKATLVVGENQTTSLTITAVSDFDDKIYDSVVVNISLVDRIEINGPSTANQGNSSIQFTANVVFAQGAPASLNKDVTWSVARKTGNKEFATTINSNGLLSIAQNEALGVLVITAKSVYDSNVTEEAELTVTDPTGAPVVHNVEVSAYPPIEDNIVLRGQKYTFIAYVSFSGSANDDVTWSVTGGSGGTKIDKKDNLGELTVAIDQTSGVELTITAVSTADTSKSGSTKVTVATPQNLYRPYQPEFSERGVAAWTYQEHAGVAGYSVQLYKGENTLGSPVTVNREAELSVNFLSAMTLPANPADKYGVYTVTVTAIADKINYFDSEPSIHSETRMVWQRETPEEPVWDDYFASWEGDSGDYKVKLFKDNAAAASKEVDVTAGTSVNLYDQITDNGYYRFSVTAPGDGYLVFASDESEKSEPKKVLRSIWITGTIQTPRQMTNSVGMFTWGGTINADETFSFSFNNPPNTNGYWFGPSASGTVTVEINTSGNDVNNDVAEFFGSAGGTWTVPATSYYQIELFPDTMKLVVIEGQPPENLGAPPAPTLAGDGTVTWSYGADENVIGYMLRLFTGTTSPYTQVGDPVQIIKGSEDHYNKDISSYTYNFRNAILENGAAAYRVNVQAMGDGRTWGDSPQSQYSNLITYAILSNPSADSRTWAGTDITWNSVKDASAYEIMISKKVNNVWRNIWDAPQIVERADEPRFAAGVHLTNREYGGTGTYSFSLRTLGSGMNLDAPAFTTSLHERFHLMLDLSETGAEGFGGNKINSIAYGGNGLFVAVGEGRVLMRSTDYGVTWTLIARGNPGPDADAFAILPASLYAVTYGNGMFIAVGNSGTIMRSTTGETWTSVVNPFTNYSTKPNLRGVTYGGGRFVAVGARGTNVSSGGTTVNRILYSANGTDWTVVENGGAGSYELLGVAYGDGRYVAVGDKGRLTISRQDNHEKWDWVSNTILNGTHQTNPGDSAVTANAVAFGNGRFVIVGDGGRTARISIRDDKGELVNISKDGDGNHAGWTRVTENVFVGTTTSVPNINDIVFAEDVGLFFAVMHNGRIGTSPTGEKWTPVPRGDGGPGTTRFTDGERIYALSYGDGRFVLGGNASATGTKAKMAYSF